MPIYTKRCDTCGRVVDLVRAPQFADAVEPCGATRGQMLEPKTDSERLVDEMRARSGLPDPSEFEYGPAPCGGTLHRGGPEGHARLSIRWGLNARGLAPRQRIAS